MPEFSFSSTAEDVTEGIDLSGKTILITGVNSGLGHESARVLAMRGAFIVGAARSTDKAQKALDELGIEGAAVACDLSEPATVRAGVEAVKGLGRKLDVIMCNAGIMNLPERTVKHGLEMQFLTNHMGHFLLVTGLLDTLSDTGRVVVTSSGAHHMAPEMGIDFDDLDGAKTYQGWRQYGQSKLANIFFAQELNKRLKGAGQWAASLHPGVIRTGLGRYDQQGTDDIIGRMDPAQVKTVGQGAATQVLLAARDDLDNPGGRYWADCNPKETSELGTNEAMAARLWTVSEELAAKLA